MMERDAKWLDEHPQYEKYSWDFHFDEKKHKDGFYYYFTQCPLNTFARREGYLEVLPVMCDIDHITASLMHAKLNRKYIGIDNSKEYLDLSIRRYQEIKE